MLERTVLLDSCSKTYAMTGWRCGYAAVPEPLRDPLERFFVNAFSCVPPFVQLAAVAALTGPDDFVTGMVAEFAARREIVVDGLNALPGVTCEAPGGAFYAFPKVDRADAIAPRLLDEAGVALLPGSDFGPAAGPPAALLRRLASPAARGPRPHGRVPGSPLSYARTAAAFARRGQGARMHATTRGAPEICRSAPGAARHVLSDRLDLRAREAAGEGRHDAAPLRTIAATVAAEGLS